jgi:hypothetical protein
MILLVLWAAALLLTLAWILVLIRGLDWVHATLAVWLS